MTRFARPVLDFDRYEFKYVLARSLREEVERELGHFVDFDPFVRHTAGHRYFVRSLYFDDAAHSAFHDKIDGLKTRAKFRLRTYSQDPGDGAPVFLERKGRHDNRVFKHRVPLDAHGLADVDLPTLLQRLEARVEDSPVIQQFLFERYRRNIEPLVLVDYLRRPYISKYDSEFRVTLDEQLRAGKSGLLFPRGVYTSVAVHPGYTIMEVKFRRHIPAWFHRIIQSYELRRVSVSKICEGMKALRMDTDLA